MSKSRAANPVVLRQGMSIGTGNAETDDEYLFDCFVNHGAVDSFTRPQSPSMVIVGRTGAGKTAIIRYIDRVKESAVEVDPSDMSMNYVSNSDALRFLSAIGADLDLLFQVLWKHVICIEFIRMRWDVDNEQKSESVFRKFADHFYRDARKQRAINYLKRWEGKFWITMDQNIKEITETYEQKLKGEFGGEIAKFKAGGQYDKRLSTGQKSELVSRYQKIVSSEQLQELSSVIEMLATESTSGAMKTHFIMIDKLDEHWVDATIRFKLIRALLSSLRSFRKIQNLKVLVALRADVRERVMQEASETSFQREKFDDFALELNWSKSQLRELIDKRMSQLFRRQYSGESITFDHVFPERVGAQDTFDWMLERTLMRPRDIIAMVNECMFVAEGNTQVTVGNIRKAEMVYSKKRRDALVQEWFSAFPSLSRILELFTSQRSSSVEINSLIPEGVEDLALQVIGDNSRPTLDPLHDICAAFLNGKASAIKLATEAAAIAYRVGAVGIKLHGQAFIYSHMAEPLIAREIMDGSTRVRLHPMLHATYRMQESG